MGRSLIGTWIGIALASYALAVGCGRKERGAAPRDAGSILLTHPDGAPLVAPVITSPPAVPPGTGELRRCRIALRRPDWGPSAGPMAQVPLKLRTVRGRGTRAEVLRFARESVCREDGIPPERCTDELFVPEYEWCDGDPVPERKPVSPEIQQLADRIRAGAEEGRPVQIGVPPAADGGPAGPPEAVDGGPVIF
mgnify:CR=1 FL=1